MIIIRQIDSNQVTVDRIIRMILRQNEGEGGWFLVVSLEEWNLRYKLIPLKVRKVRSGGKATVPHPWRRTSWLNSGRRLPSRRWTRRGWRCHPSRLSPAQWDHPRWTTVRHECRCLPTSQSLLNRMCVKKVLPALFPKMVIGLMWLKQKKKCYLFFFNLMI